MSNIVNQDDCELCDGCGEVHASTKRAGAGQFEDIACPLCLQVEKDAEIARLSSLVEEKDKTLFAAQQALIREGMERDAALALVQRMKDGDEYTVDHYKAFWETYHGLPEGTGKWHAWAEGITAMMAIPFPSDHSRG